jgi:ribosomal protein S18 acetylase RimI-like enzyme
VWTQSAYRRQGIGAAMVRQLMSRVPGQPVFMSAVVGKWLDNEANHS